MLEIHKKIIKINNNDKRYKIDTVKFKDTIKDYIQRVIDKKLHTAIYREGGMKEKTFDRMQNKIRNFAIQQMTQNSYIEFYLDYTNKNGVDANALAELNKDNASETLQFYYEQKLEYSKDEISKFKIGPYKKVGKKGKSYSFHKTAPDSMIPNATVPDRPFFSPVIHLYESVALRRTTNEIRKKLKDYDIKERDKQFFSKSFIKDFYETFGIKMIEFYKKWFDTRGKGSWAPNTQATIKIKKSNKPMIDTGGLREALRYHIHLEGYEKGKNYRGRFKWADTVKKIKNTSEEIYSKEN